ncbi:MAG: hypothetical protein AAB795_02575 [Patescibacteria group bacterium]
MKNEGVSENNTELYGENIDRWGDNCFYFRISLTLRKKIRNEISEGDIEAQIKLLRKKANEHNFTFGDAMLILHDFSDVELREAAIRSRCVDVAQALKEISNPPDYRAPEDKLLDAIFGSEKDKQ